MPAPIIRVYVATNWNTVTTVHGVFERPAPKASGRTVDYWADVTVDNNGGTPHRCEVSISDGFVRIENPDHRWSTARSLAADAPRYCTREQLVEHFRGAILEWRPVNYQAEHPDLYLTAEYRGLTLELYFNRAGYWQWSFYDPNSPEPDLAVAAGAPSTDRDAAEAELLDYIAGYLPE